MLTLVALVVVQISEPAFPRVSVVGLAVNVHVGAFGDGGGVTIVTQVTLPEALAATRVYVPACAEATAQEPLESDETGVPLIVTAVAADVDHEIAVAEVLVVRVQVGCVVTVAVALAEAAAAADAAAAAPEAEEPEPPVEAAAPEAEALPAATPTTGT